ncbi:MAG: glycosyltransferase family 2 protein [Anaerolineales bacterium]|nr:glycosyltransferase family 2 protein [Anaerolineales bacterium]
MDLSIIIVSWNTADLLQACLASVYAHAPCCAYDVWVVDNASTDDSAGMVRQQFPQAQLIANTDNVGFARANNQAIAASRGRYVLLLNPDTEVKPGALQALVDFLDAHPRAGAAGSMLLNPDESLQPSCHPMPTLAREFWRLFHLDVVWSYGRYAMQRWDTAVPRDVDVIQGASFLIRRAIVDRIGFLDGDYFMYSEEVDLCYRLQKHGWRLYWVPASRVIHYGGQSTRLVAEKMFLELYRGKVMFFRKHYGARTARLYKSVIALAALPRLVVAAAARVLPLPRRAELRQLGPYYRHLLRRLPEM